THRAAAAEKMITDSANAFGNDAIEAANLKNVGGVHISDFSQRYWPCQRRFTSGVTPPPSWYSRSILTAMRLLARRWIHTDTFAPAVDMFGIHVCLPIHRMDTFAIKCAYAYFSQEKSDERGQRRLRDLSSTSPNPV